MFHKGSLSPVILKYIRDNPGVTGAEVQKQFVDDELKGTISTALGRLRREGYIKNGGNKGPDTKWFPIVKCTHCDKEIVFDKVWSHSHSKKTHCDVTYATPKI